MPSSPTACLWFDEAGCVTVYIEYHFARGKSCDRIRVRRDIVKKLKGLGVMECDGIPLVMTPSHLFAHHVMSPDVIVV